MSHKIRSRAPMWRNGRRNGLKIRSREGGVWVRIPSSAPSKMRFYEGKLLKLAIQSVANCRAPKPAKPPSICQLFVNWLAGFFLAGSVFGFEILLSGPNPKSFRRLAMLVEQREVAPEHPVYWGCCRRRASSLRRSSRLRRRSCVWV